MAVVLVDSKDASSVAHSAADLVVEKAFSMVENQAAFEGRILGSWVSRLTVIMAVKLVFVFVFLMFD